MSIHLIILKKNTESKNIIKSKLPLDSKYYLIIEASSH